MKKLSYLLILLMNCIGLSGLAQDLHPAFDKQSEKWGYKDKEDIDWLLSPQYTSASKFINRIAVVSDGERIFAINSLGQKISPDFKALHLPNEFLQTPAWGETADGKFQIYDLQFKPISHHSYQQLSPMWPYLFAIQQNGLYGIIDYYGHKIIPAQYKKLKANNLYYACGYKRCEKDGIKNSQFDTFFEVQDSIGHYGVISLNHDTIMPFKFKSSYALYKAAKRYYKKGFKPCILSSRHQQTLQNAKNIADSIKALNKKLVAQYPTDIPIVEKTKVKKLKKGYAFYKGKKLIGKLCQNITRSGRYYIIKRNGKYGVANLAGHDILPCQYNQIDIWNAGSKGNIFLTQQNKQYRLIDAEGNNLTEPYDIIFFPSNEVGVAVNKGSYWLINEEGRIASNRGYANIDNYSDSGKIFAELYGYKTELTKNGKEVTPIAQQIFKEAYDLSLQNNAQEKYDKYTLCASLDENNKLGIRSLAINNIGAMFEDLGDVDKAMTYYEKARNMGNETARKNIKRIRMNRAMNALQQVGQTLTEVAQTLDTSKSYNTLQTAGGDANDNYSSTSMPSSSSSGSKGKLSYDYYINAYQRWERNAKSVYESLTMMGTREKRNGQDEHGSAQGTWNHASYSGMKRNLRTAQREMKKLRMQARKDGYNISPSNYETVTVSY